MGGGFADDDTKGFIEKYSNEKCPNKKQTFQQKISNFLKYPNDFWKGTFFYGIYYDQPSQTSKNQESHP